MPNAEAVYKARDERLHATVAVKEATVSDRQLLVAFENEARRLARPMRLAKGVGPFCRGVWALFGHGIH